MKEVKMLLNELEEAKVKALTCKEGQYKPAGPHFGGARYNSKYYVYCLSDYKPANCNQTLKLPGWKKKHSASEIPIMEQIEIRKDSMNHQ